MAQMKAQIKTPEKALAGAAQWMEYQTVNQKVTSWIPSQGTCLGCRPGPQEGTCGRQPHTDVSLSRSLYFSTKNKQNLLIFF